MRIRKHAAGRVYEAAAAAAGYSLNPATGGASIQSPHLCQLNQSPWDAFSDYPSLSEYLVDEYDPAADLLPPPPPPPPQPPPVDGEVSSFENGSISELHQPQYSELSMNVEKWEDKNGSHSDSNREQLQLKKKHCINARKPEKNNNNPKRKPKKKPAAAAAALVSSSSSNPYEYYYYSGFGPCWRKKNRGGNSMEAGDKMVVEIEIGSSSYNSKSLQHEAGGDHEEVESYNSESLENDTIRELEDKRICPGQVVLKADSFTGRARNGICNFEDGLDYVDVDEDEDEDEDDDDNVESVSRKRGRRKPVKARSLKSLMDKRT